MSLKARNVHWLLQGKAALRGENQKLFELIQCKMGLTSLHDLLRFVTFVHLPFSVRSLDLFCRFTRVYDGHFMLCYRKEF